MFDQHFLSSAAATDVFGPLHGGERMMWRGRCGVAEYAFDEAASLPRWTLPESTDVLVTDQRVLYAYTADDGHQVKSGELRWLWPQHLRVQPGSRSRDRGAAATQIQLVCGGADGSYPALVFAGGDLATVADADRVANVIRQAIARFRVDNAAKIGLSTGQTRMLSRLLIGPEFRNHQGGEGQTVSLLGALLVNRPAPAPALPTVTSAPPAAVAPPPPAAASAPPAAASASPAAASASPAAASASPAAASASPAAYLPSAGVSAPPAIPAPRAGSAPRAGAVPAFDPMQSPGDSGTRLISYRPGMAADAARALMAAKAEEVAQTTEPATASRAADLAARVASLVSQFAELDAPTPGTAETWSPPVDAADDLPAAGFQPRPAYTGPRHAEPADPDRFEVPTTNLAARAEAVRRTAARMAANSASFRAGNRRADREPGITTRGNRTT